MTEPAETVVVYWGDRPPRSCERIGDLRRRDHVRMTEWVWWRHRWCCFARELVEIMTGGDVDALVGLLDQKAAAGEIGILFERIEGAT